MKRCARPLMLLTVLGLLAPFFGCLVLIPRSVITQPVPVPDPAERISSTIGLYVSTEAKAVVLQDRNSAKKEGMGYSLDIGPAIEPSARDSLAKLFSEVVAVGAPGDGRFRVLEVRLDDRSMIDPGPSTLSPKTVQITLACILRSGDGKVLWQDTVSGSGSRKSKAAYLSTIIVIRRWLMRKLTEALGQAGDEALGKCLDSLNQKLSGQRALFR